MTAAPASDAIVTRAGLALLSSGLTLVLAGVALGNAALVLTAAFPLVLLVAATVRRAGVPRVRRDVHERVIRKGERLVMDLRVTLPAGRYALEVQQPLPGGFDVARGASVHVLTARAQKETTHHLTLEATALQRGAFTLPAVRWERIGLTGLDAPQSGEAAGTLALEVAPAAGVLPRAERVRVKSGQESGVPRVGLGLPGTDFRDLRQYVRGDPPRTINWKATARRMASGASATPLVNEYEHEGKRTILVAVDAAAPLNVGTSVETALDHAVDAAAGLSAFLLERGHRVGALVAGSGPDAPHVHPDTGRAHGGRIARALARTFPATAPHTSGHALADAVERAGAVAGGSVPLLIVFTRITGDGDALAHALTRARHALRVRSGAARLPVVLVDVRALALVPDADDARAEDARAVLETLDERARHAARRAGATVVSWDPAKESFASAFLKEVPL